MAGKSAAAGPTLDGMGARVRRRNFGKNHAYYFTQPGGEEVKLDGVTTLIGGGLPKPALVNWAARSAAERAVNEWDRLATLSVSDRLKEIQFAHRDDRDQAANRGTQVHALAEKMLHGEAFDGPEFLRPHAESAVRFMDDFQWEPVLTETTVYSERHLYGGTFDTLGRSLLPAHEGKVILADWKTSRSGIFAEAAIQMSAYRHADFYVDGDSIEHPMAELGVTDTWALWIRADGYDVYEVDTSESTFKFFQYIAAVARRAKALEDHPLVGEALDRPGVAA